MKHLTWTAAYAAIAYLVALGLLSLLASCGAVTGPAVAVAALSSSCLTPEQTADASAKLQFSILEVLDEAEAGGITGDELSLRLRESLSNYAGELATQFASNAGELIAGKLKTSERDSTAAGGLIGAASAAATYLIREMSWRKKRAPQVLKAAKGDKLELEA